MIAWLASSRSGNRERYISTINLWRDVGQVYKRKGPRKYFRSLAKSYTGLQKGAIIQKKDFYTLLHDKLQVPALLTDIKISI